MGPMVSGSRTPFRANAHRARAERSLWRRIGEDARPTKQMGLYRQMIGRGLRPSEGKADCIILDHAGAWDRHGLPEDRIEWPLHVDQRAENPTQERRARGEAKASRMPAMQAPNDGPALRGLRLDASGAPCS